MAQEVLSYYLSFLKVTSTAVLGMNFPHDPSFSLNCEPCLLGNQTGSPHVSNPDKTRWPIPGEFIHTDLCGPLSQTSIGGANYFIPFKVDSSGYSFIDFLRNKSDALDYFKALVALIQNELKVKVIKLKSDWGGEFTSNVFKQYLIDSGTQDELSAAYTPEQNSLIERRNRTVVEAMRTMLHSVSSLPLSLWAEAPSTTIHVWNRTVNTQLVNITPYEKVISSKPDLSYFRTFGSTTYQHVPKSLRNKLAAKSEKVVFVGYTGMGKSYRLWHPGTKKISVSSGVQIFVLPFDANPHQPLFSTTEGGYDCCFYTFIKGSCSCSCSCSSYSSSGTPIRCCVRT